VLHALLAQLVNALMAGEARAHARQELGTGALAAFRLLVSLASPGVFDIFIHFQLVLQMQAHAHLRRVAAVLDVLRDPRRNRLGLNLSLGVPDHCLLRRSQDGLDCLSCLCSRASTHFIY